MWYISYRMQFHLIFFWLLFFSYISSVFHLIPSDHVVFLLSSSHLVQCISMWPYLLTCGWWPPDPMCFSLSGQKLGSAGVIVDTVPLHHPQQLKELSKAWYSGNQLSQPLGGWKLSRQLWSWVVASDRPISPYWIYCSRNLFDVFFLFQIRSTRTLEAPSPFTSVSWIFTHGLCCLQHCWDCVSHTTQVGVPELSMVSQSVPKP